MKTKDELDESVEEDAHDGSSDTEPEDAEGSEHPSSEDFSFDLASLHITCFVAGSFYRFYKFYLLSIVFV